MNRILLGVGLAALLFASGVTVGYKIHKGKTAEQDKKIIINKVVDHNEDIITLQEHTKQIAEIEKRYKKQLADIPRVSVNTPDCPEFRRVYNEAVRSANSVSFED